MDISPHHRSIWNVDCILGEPMHFISWMKSDWLEIYEILEYTCRIDTIFVIYQYTWKYGKHLFKLNMLLITYVALLSFNSKLYLNLSCWFRFLRYKLCVFFITTPSLTSLDFLHVLTLLMIALLFQNKWDLLIILFKISY